MWNDATTESWIKAKQKQYSLLKIISRQCNLKTGSSTQHSRFQPIKDNTAWRFKSGSPIFWWKEDNSASKKIHSSTQAGSNDNQRERQAAQQFAQEKPNPQSIFQTKSRTSWDWCTHSTTQYRLSRVVIRVAENNAVKVAPCNIQTIRKVKMFRIIWKNTTTETLTETKQQKYILLKITTRSCETMQPQNLGSKPSKNNTAYSRS